jgi:tRNA modification GTPase
MSSVSDTIYAVSTAIGKSAIAVVRLSGPQSRFAAETISGSNLIERRMQLRTLANQEGEILDHALVTWFKAPATYTGEDVAEFYLHGGKAVIDGLLDCLARFDGLRAAEAGEFTYRAFAAGRMDLSEVEGIADLLNAETGYQRQQALRQASGAFREIIETLSKDITLSRAYLEATIDFSDQEDVPDSVMDATRSSVADLMARIETQLAASRAGERLRDGYRVVFAGLPNAGKSSLLNALAKRDVAIVSDEPGTTRDVIEVHLDLQGVPVTIIDTAGFRVAPGTVEQIGQDRARSQLLSADLVFWLHSANDSPPKFTDDLPNDLHDVLAPQLLITKTDLARGPDAAPEGFAGLSSVCVRDEPSVTALLGHIRAQAAGHLSAAMKEAVPTRARHREALIKAGQELEACLSLLAHGGAPEMAAEHLRLASCALEFITGRVQPDDLLGIIFAEFCIGK